MTSAANIRLLRGEGAITLSADRSDAAVAERDIANAMTIDVEEYFQVSGLAPQVPRRTWDSYPSRVERNTNIVLDMLADRGARGTFFVLGWIAERFPTLIRRIVDAGHELASHGHDHVRIFDQSQKAFRADVTRSKHILEDVSGTVVKGYRAPCFSIVKNTLWAFDVLAEVGYRYSSSVYPIRHDLYGMHDAPRFAYHPIAGSDFLEIPVATVRIGGRNLPCGGGGCLRLLPYVFSRWALRRVNRAEGRPCVIYCHPWEFDPDQPRILGGALRMRLRHYTNLKRTKGKLESALADFRWDRMDRVYPSIAGVVSKPR